jgi:predicted acyltransferase
MTTLVTTSPPVTNAPSATTPATSLDRVLSVDALRGFDMLWITGAGALLRALSGVTNNSVTREISTQLKHVQWEGFRFYDLIFPLFLFLIGVSLVYSLDKAIARDGMAAALKRIVRRSVVLFLLGVFFYGGLSAKWPDVALAGVLQRIAFCYFFAALIYCACANRLKTMAVVAAALLVGYWALVTFVPFPDLKLDKETVTKIAERIGSDSPFAVAAAVSTRVRGLYEEGRNLTNYLDFLFLPGKKTEIYYINEGLLSTLPSIAICLFGAFAGRLLKNQRVEPKRKVAWLLAAGAAGVVLGLLWSVQFPLIKRIWTSSFCLVAGGLSAIVFAEFYLIVDVWKCQRWCQPLVWFGMNSITIYLAVNVLSFPKIAERLVGGDVKAFFDTQIAEGLGAVVIALTAFGLAILFCWFLHRKRIFLRL